MLDRISHTHWSGYAAVRNVRHSSFRSPSTIHNSYHCTHPKHPQKEVYPSRWSQENRLKVVFLHQNSHKISGKGNGQYKVVLILPFCILLFKWEYYFPLTNICSFLLNIYTAKNSPFPWIHTCCHVVIHSSCVEFTGRSLSNLPSTGFWFTEQLSRAFCANLPV